MKHWTLDFRTDASYGAGTVGMEGIYFACEDMNFWGPQAECSRLNVCVSVTSYVEALVLSVMVFEGGAFGR